MPGLQNFKSVSLVAAGLNFIASVAMLLFLKPGLAPETELMTRLRYIMVHQGMWVGSWLIWILAALSLIVFLIYWAYALLGAARHELRPWIFFGALSGVVGMIPDTIAETIYMGVIPHLAETILGTSGNRVEAAMLRFGEWEIVASLLTGFLGNGFYCIGGFTLQVVSLKTGTLPPFCRLFGFVPWVSGFGLSVAALSASPVGLYFFTAVTMASFILWAALVGILPHPEKTS